MNFHCVKCNKTFQSEGYDNPIFRADKVANCPDCNIKCWKESNSNHG